MAEGFISHIGRHVGGLASPPASATPLGGYRSFWGFWFGGMAVDTSEPAPAAEVVGGDDVPHGFTTGSKRGGRRKRRTDAERMAEMQLAYARLMGEVPEPVAAAVAEAVRPHVETASDARLPPVDAIDWASLAKDLAAIAVILKLYRQAIDEEEEITLLLLSS